MDFTDFYRRARDECLRVVLVSVGDQDTAQDLVDEAFARACASWPSAQLAAWTVAKQSGGDIYVTIRELQDPAGLQRTLRADGLPVTVSFSGPKLSPGCQPYAPSKSQLRDVAQFHPRDRDAVLVIHPSAVPAGTGVFIFERPGAQPPPSAPGLFPLAVGLVYASQQCTGS